MQVIQQVRTWLRGGSPPLAATAAATGLDSPAAAGGQGSVLGTATDGRVRPRRASVAEHVTALVARLERDRPDDDCKAFRDYGICAHWRVLETYTVVAKQLQLVRLHDLELLEALGQHCRRARLMALPATSMKPARQTCYVLGEPAAAAGKPTGKKNKRSRQRDPGSSPGGSRSRDVAMVPPGGGGNRLGRMYRPPAGVLAS